MTWDPQAELTTVPDEIEIEEEEDKVEAEGECILPSPASILSTAGFGAAVLTMAKAARMQKGSIESIMSRASSTDESQRKEIFWREGSRIRE